MSNIICSKSNTKQSLHINARHCWLKKPPKSRRRVVNQIRTCTLQCLVSYRRQCPKTMFYLKNREELVRKMRWNQKTILSSPSQDFLGDTICWFFFIFFLFKKWKLCLFIYLLMGIHAWARAQRWRLEDHLPILVLSFYHVGLSTELRLPGLALSTLPAEPSPQLQSNFLNHKLPSFPLDSIPSSWCNTPCRGNRRSSLFVFCVGKEDKWPWTQFFSFLP